MNFIKAIEENPTCKTLYKKWVNNIANTEFITYKVNGVPPQIIERIRSYLINKYSSITDPLMKRTINKIKNAKIRSID